MLNHVSFAFWPLFQLAGKYPLFFNLPGIVEGNSEVEIKVTFEPMDFSTAHMKLQVN